MYIVQYAIYKEAIYKAKLLMQFTKIYFLTLLDASSRHKKCSWHVILRPTIEESEREAVGGWCVLNLSCVLKSLKLLNIDGVVLEHLYY